MSAIPVLARAITEIVSTTSEAINVRLTINIGTCGLPDTGRVDVVRVVQNDSGIGIGYTFATGREHKIKTRPKPTSESIAH